MTANVTGNGTQVVVTGGAPWSGRVQSVSGFRRSVAVLDDTGLDTSGYEEHVFAELKAHETITVAVLVDSAAMTLPTLGTSKNWSFVLPGGRTLAGTGAIVASVSSELVSGTRLRETFDFKFDGKTGPTLSN